jgi:hypothetical protein
MGPRRIRVGTGDAHRGLVQRKHATIACNNASDSDLQALHQW